MPNTTTTTTAPTPRTVAERQAADGLAACRAARAKRRDAVTVPLAERFGAGATVAVVPRWRGAALCIHAPIRDGVPTPTRGQWVITSTAYGYAAGTYRGTLAAAVKLARLWDAAFGAALAAAPIGAAGVPTLAEWSQARAWSRQVSGDAPAYGPVDAPRREPVAAADGDGAEQYPASVTLSAVVVDGKRRIRYARRLPNGRERLRTPDGRAVRMDGDVAAFADGAGVRLCLWFAAAWHHVPSMAECMEWTLDGVAETPDGSRVEPDAPNSWLSLLGLN